MVVFVGGEGFPVASVGVELDLFRGYHLGFDVWCLRPLRQGFVVRRCELSDAILNLTNSPDSIVRAWPGVYLLPELNQPNIQPVCHLQKLPQPPH